MAVNVLNRFGSISFSNLTNNNENSSINSLLESFLTLGSSDFSVSSSFTEIKKRNGNFLNETSFDNITNSIGTGLLNYGVGNEIRFSNFYGALYLSASITPDVVNGGTCLAKLYSPSLNVNNNFLTRNSKDQVFKFSLYTKTGTSTPISDTGWKKTLVYTVPNVDNLTFHNLVDTNSYKLVVRDCLTNAFTSSMFVGNCTNVNVNDQSYNYNIYSPSLTTSVSLIKKKINDDKSFFTVLQQLDLNQILSNLENVITNPKSFLSANSKYPTVTYTDPYGYSRSLKYEGIIFQKIINGTTVNVFDGVVSCKSTGGTSTDLYYSFDDTNTKGDISLWILGKQISTGTGCTSVPTKLGYLPNTIYVSGPDCGELDCKFGGAQIICNPTSTNQVRHSGSFTITNYNDTDLSVVINNDWIDDSGNPIDNSLLPVQITPSSFSIPAYSFKKVSIGFGVGSYTSNEQLSKFKVSSTIDFQLPNTYTPYQKTSILRASFDKEISIFTVNPKVVTTLTSNVGQLLYNGSINENWGNVKNKITNLINSGTGDLSDKIFARAIIQALPNTDCTLSQLITIGNYNINLEWILVENGEQPYVCNNTQFSGTYFINLNNNILGQSKFYISFIRKNDTSNLGTFIKLIQLGGTSNPSFDN